MGGTIPLVQTAFLMKSLQNTLAISRQPIWLGMERIFKETSRRNVSLVHPYHCKGTDTSPDEYQMPLLLFSFKGKVA
jgi:hypothetical protein